MIIGIDFGTCYSSVAVMSGNLPVTNLLKDTTGMGVPSLFMYFDSDGKELYGEECLTGAAIRKSSDVVRYMKRIVREDPANLDRTVVSGGQEYTFRQIIQKYLAFLIGEIKAAAVKNGEFRITDFEAVTITAPVGIAEGQMMASEYNRLLQDTVCEITGLPEDKVRILQEPVAAAITYLYSEDIRTRYEGIQKVLVFDLGGGTLDVTIVEHDPSTMEYRILAKEGDLMLGGNDWDAALGQAVLDKLGLTWSGTDEERAMFNFEITKLKMDLSNQEDAVIIFQMGRKDRYTHFTRTEFEGCTADLLERAMDVVRKALGFDSGSAPDKYVLVGGSSNMPQISRGLEEALGINAGQFSVYEPSKAIAKGAAIFAKMNSSTDGSAIGPKVLDMATLTYGFSSLHHGDREGIYNLIYKGTPFDDSGRIIRKSDTDFIPLRDDQTQVSFMIYESESREGDGFDGNWFDMDGGATFNGLEVTVQVPAEYMGRARRFRMWATLSLDENGILDITVTDRNGKKLAYATSSKM